MSGRHAPDASKQSLATLQKNFGLIPNLAATMAASPTLINGFVGALVNFLDGTFSGGERQVLLLANAVANRSPWAVAFHSTAALREGIDSADVDAIRNGRRPNDPNVAALSTLTARCIETHGRLTDADIVAFTSAGYTPEQVLEVLAGVAISAMANYAGNITKPAVEAPFQAEEARGSVVGREDVPMAIHCDRRIRLLLLENRVERRTNRRECFIGKTRFAKDRCESRGEEQSVSLAEWNGQRLGESEDHRPARLGASGLDEADVATRNVGFMSEPELAQVARLAPVLQQEADGRSAR